MKRACVIGWPIHHSRSPLIHGYWIRQHGLDASYERQAVQPAELGEFVKRLRQGDFVGCNVTLPHKERITELVDDADDRVRRTGSANTLWLRDGRLFATSTDGPGFLANLIASVPSLAINQSPVVILGAGGSASAIADELLRAAAPQIIICNRTLARAQELESRFAGKIKAAPLADLPQHLPNTGLLINTTSAGIANQDRLDIPFGLLPQIAIVADIVYTPLVTPFLQQARAHGHRIVPGLGMLLHQAVPGFEAWFGVRPHVTQELYDLIASDIDPEYRP